MRAYNGKAEMPDILYHGSTTLHHVGKYVKVFKQKTVNGKSGNFLFATPHYEYACCYALRAATNRLPDRQSVWNRCGTTEDPTERYFFNFLPLQYDVETDVNLICTAPASVLTLSSKGFAPSAHGPKDGTIFAEWVSEQKALVQSAETVSGADILCKGIQLFLAHQDVIIASIKNANSLTTEWFSKQIRTGKAHWVNGRKEFDDRPSARPARHCAKLLGPCN